MSNPTPSPRPAALVESIAATVSEDTGLRHALAVAAVEGFIAAAGRHDHVLIPRAELEEAAEAVWRLASLNDESNAHPGPNMNLAERLTQRSRG